MRTSWLAWRTTSGPAPPETPGRGLNTPGPGGESPGSRRSPPVTPACQASSPAAGPGVRRPEDRVISIMSTSNRMPGQSRLAVMKLPSWVHFTISTYGDTRSSVGHVAGCRGCWGRRAVPLGDHLSHRACAAAVRAAYVPHTHPGSAPAAPAPRVTTPGYPPSALPAQDPLLSRGSAASSPSALPTTRRSPSPPPSPSPSPSPSSSPSPGASSPSLSPSPSSPAPTVSAGHRRKPARAR